MEQNLIMLYYADTILLVIALKKKHHNRCIKLVERKHDTYILYAQNKISLLFTHNVMLEKLIFFILW